MARKAGKIPLSGTINIININQLKAGWRNFGALGLFCFRPTGHYTALMASISLSINQQWAGSLVVHPWSRAQIGVRRKSGGLRYVPFGGLLQKSWLPLWVTPCALAVTGWNYSDAHSTDQRRILSGFVVGALIEQRAFVVLYDGRPREV